MQFGLIGENVTYSRSKRIHGLLAEYDYELRSLAREELDPFMRARDFVGLNVTIPYKRDVMPYCDVITPAAQAIGSVNTLTIRDGIMTGDNTDYHGVKYLAAHAGISFAGKKVIICGSGGTSRTVRAAALDGGAHAAVVLSRTGEDDYVNGPARHADAEIIVNTSPLGMYPKHVGKQAVSLDDWPNVTGVLDVVYIPLKTALVLDAERRGLRTEGGLAMLVAQAKYASELFTGTSIDDAKIAEILEILTKEMQQEQI